MSARPGEKAALHVLNRVLEEGAYWNLAFSEECKQYSLSGKDRSAAAAYGKLTLEHLYGVDFALSKVTDLKKCKKQVRNILRMAASRLLFTDTPPAICTHAAVELAKSIGKGGQANYINAVLRNLARQKEEMEWPDEKEDAVAALSIRYSWPEFAVQEAIALFGVEEAKAFLAPRMEERIALRNNIRHQSRDQLIQCLKELGGQAQPSAFFQEGVLLSGLSDLTGLKGYQQGDFSIQSEASMLTASIALPERGLVLDLCAAPGGKACLMAEALGDRGEVIASDVHAHRVELIAAQKKRLGLENLVVTEGDATVSREEYRGQADAVLLDVPCSGMGTAQHRPDVKYHRVKEDIAELSQMQRRIIKTCADYVKPGGILVYSTCTFFREENEMVIRDFLSSRKDFRVISMEDGLPDALQGLEGKCGLRLLPQRDGTDAFYICKMERMR